MIRQCFYIVPPAHFLAVNFKGFLLDGVAIDTEVFLKKYTEGFEDAAIEVFVVFLFENISQIIEPEHQADRFFDQSSQVGRQSIIFKIIGHQYSVATGINHLDPGDKIIMVDFILPAKASQGEFHEHMKFCRVHIFSGNKLGLGFFQHIHIHIGEWPETTPFNQAGMFVEFFRSLNHKSFFIEHH